MSLRGFVRPRARLAEVPLTLFKYDRHAVLIQHMAHGPGKVSRDDRFVIHVFFPIELAPITDDIAALREGLRIGIAHQGAHHRLGREIEMRKRLPLPKNALGQVDGKCILRYVHEPGIKPPDVLEAHRAHGLDERRVMAPILVVQKNNKAYCFRSKPAIPLVDGTPLRRDPNKALDLGGKELTPSQPVWLKGDN